ncbi:hypothetical protein C8J57DRAFT_1279892 [Mycena rebaudengoi]|nr:hypothetical protein C8J57DRAFT_1279892 [Mycena rebaudengoi]
MKPPPPKAPITPSASPAPVSESNSFFPAPYRIPDAAPPLKRRRCSSTPRASSSATPDDFNTEREASALRMFDVWSQLAEKYTRRIDEDDIVDLVTGEIVKDRGVLSAATPWKFGRFADLEGSTGTDDDDEDDSEQLYGRPNLTDEDDVDELDAFAESGGTEEVWVVPPVRKMDPADARDLEEFMEAEKRRKEECGDEDASEDNDDLASYNVQAEVRDAGDDVDEIREPQVLETPVSSLNADINESDDELGNWDILDASNIVYTVEKPDPDLEVLDSPPTTPTNFVRGKTSSTQTLAKAPSSSKATPDSRRDQNSRSRLQLHTPPKSRTPSSQLSFEDDYVIPISVASPPSSPLPSSYGPCSSSPIKPRSTPKHVDPSASQPRTRSQSRARSFQPRTDGSRTRGDDDPVPVPRLDLAEISRGRSATRGAARSRSAAAGMPSENPGAVMGKHPQKRSGEKPKSMTPLPSKTSLVSPRTVRRDTRQSSPVRASEDTVSPAPVSPVKGKEKQRVVKRSPTSKGKARMTDSNRGSGDEDYWWEGTGDPTGASVSERTERRKSQPRSSTGLPPTPEPVPPSTTRKRKRNSLLDDEPIRDFDATDNYNRASSSSDAHSLSDTPLKPKSKHKPRAARLEEPLDSDSHRRSDPHSAAVPSSYYPPMGSFYPYTPYTPPGAPQYDTDTQPLIPLQDPRAQLIISQAMQQAMHQLSNLFAGPWTPGQPFTPPRHPPSTRSTSGSGSSPYSYPSTPHHPHAYPYVFNSGTSAGTLPPSSPPTSSPPSLASSPIRAGRPPSRPRSSLVSQSRSRGRRVSFTMEDELIDVERDAGDTGVVSHGCNRRGTRHREYPNDNESDHSPSKATKSNGKAKKEQEYVSDSEASEGDSRSGTVERAQTPGPPVSTKAGSSKPTASRARGRSSATGSPNTRGTFKTKPKGKSGKPI